MGRRARAARRPVDIDTVRSGLESPDDQVRLGSLRQCCPCRSGYSVYEAFRSEVWRLRKDPHPEIRRLALHIEHEAGEIESKVNRLELAAEQGFPAGDAGWLKDQERRYATGTWEPL
jgi:hypothetical protein